MTNLEQDGSPTISLPIYDSKSQLITTDTSAKRAPQYVAGLTASIAVLSAGTTLAWTSQISEQLMNGELGFDITESELGWVGSLMPLGAASLSIFTGIICERLGRKITMLLLILPAILGWSLIIWAQSITMLYLGRFITGMVAGSFCVVTSIYNSEISQKEIRGALGSFTQLMISSGVLFANVLAKYLSVQDYTITCASIPLLFGLIFVFMPETPVYLLKKNKMEQAKRVLIRLRGPNYDVDGEIKEIETNVKENCTHMSFKTIKQCLQKRSSRKACMIGFGLMIFKVINGIDAFTAYTSYIFTSAGAKLDAQIGTIIINVFQVSTAICQSLVVDKVGRRILLCVSSAIMTVCLIVVGTTLLLKTRNVISEEYYIYVDYLPLIGLVIFTISFSLGLGPIPWLMMGEIFPQEIKSLASSMATFVSWITSFVVIKLYLEINIYWGGDVAFFIFAGCTFSAMMFSLIVVPETKNKTFEEIQKELE